MPVTGLRVEIYRQSSNCSQAARDTARSLCCSPETLEMLADMRGQFFGMLAAAGFAARPQQPTAGGGWAAARDGADDVRAPYNRHAGRPAVVRAERRTLRAETLPTRLWPVRKAVRRPSRPYDTHRCCHHSWVTATPRMVAVWACSTLRTSAAGEGGAVRRPVPCGAGHGRGRASDRPPYLAR